MAVPTTIADLSTTAASNSPSGSDSIGTSLDDYLRAIQGIQKSVLSKGADIASATTPTFGNDGSYFVITGTTPITGFSDAWNGRTVAVKFSGILTFTHSASLILPGAANVTTAAGDTAILTNESAGVWRCVAYQLASLAPGSAAFSAVSDATAIVKGSSDATKLLRFEVDGFTTGTTRVLTPPNADVTIAGLEAVQTWTKSQRGTVTTSNTITAIDLGATNNHISTPSAGAALTFTNLTAGQCGTIEFVNGSNYAITAGSGTKVTSTFLATISATGTYIISYYVNAAGTAVHCSTGGASA